MMTRQSITRTKQRIERHLNILQKELAGYEEAANQLSQTKEKLKNLVFRSRINVLEPVGFELLLTLIETSTKLQNENDLRLREIDNITAVITGYLTLLLEECINNYTPELKVWLKSRIMRLADMREITVGSYKKYLSFPIAVAQLTPYLIKTREVDASPNMVSIRQAISLLSEASY